MWPRGPVIKAGLTLGAEAGDPPVGTLARDPEFFRYVGDRSSVVEHALNQHTPAMEVQTSVSVGHEDLLVGEDVRHLH
jgi:hypothetical protein